jgi:hypothetical protein
MENRPPSVSDTLDATDSELRRRIEERAYLLWESNGRPEGRALDYWLQAEREIVDQSEAREGSSSQEGTRRRRASEPAGAT